MWRSATITALCLACAVVPAFAATEQPDAVQKQFQTMQQTLNNMHSTENAAELNTLMQQHMAEMMSGMQMMHRMMGGQSAGMMGGQSGSMMSGQVSGSTHAGPPTDAIANMQQHMSMMWMMMNQMMQHMQEQQRLDQQHK